MTTAEAGAVGAVFAATQRDLAKRTAAIVAAYWLQDMSEQDPSTLRDAAEAWLSRSIPVIVRARKQSEQRARGYYQAKRRLDLPDEPLLKIPSLPEVDRKALTSSLWVVGPQQYVDAGRAVDDIFTEERINAITGAVARHTMNGGRDLIDSAIQSDPKVLGYYRTEDNDPCYFCAMLMSRGTVFKKDSFDASDTRFFGPGDAKVHDHCGGGLAAEYTDDPYPGNTREFGDMWQEFLKEDTPNDAESWRQFYEARQLATAA